MASKRTSQRRKRSDSKALKISDLPQKLVPGYLSTYSNYAEVGCSPLDFRFTFFEVVEDETGNYIREKRSRVVMTPQHAIRVAEILNAKIEEWLKENTNLTPDRIEKLRRGEKVQ